MLPRAGESREGEEEEGDVGGEQREGNMEGNGMGCSWGVEAGNCPVFLRLPWDVGDPCGLWSMKEDGCWQWPSH